MSEYSKQEIAELRKLVSDKRENLRTVRFGAAGSRSRDTRESRNLRKDIARIMTELRKREIDSAKKIA